MGLQCVSELKNDYFTSAVTGSEGLCDACDAPKLADALQRHRDNLQTVNSGRLIHEGYKKTSSLCLFASLLLFCLDSFLTTAAEVKHCVHSCQPV